MKYFLERISDGIPAGICERNPEGISEEIFNEIPSEILETTFE